uniref:Uncharacterized protein n=1 Tax=Octopus bimaculoides TaxID=37653 RepID=A0A0L8IHA1_OCTBM
MALARNQYHRLGLQTDSGSPDFLLHYSVHATGISNIKVLTAEVWHVCCYTAFINACIGTACKTSTQLEKYVR